MRFFPIITGLLLIQLFIFLPVIRTYQGESLYRDQPHVDEVTQILLEQAQREGIGLVNTSVEAIGIVQYDGQYGGGQGTILQCTAVYYGNLILDLALVILLVAVYRLEK